MAEDVMQWAYDLIVLDPYGNFNRKVSETLLDGILGINMFNRSKGLRTKVANNGI